MRFRDGFAEGLPGLGVADGLVFLLDAGNGVEEELPEVTEGQGILAVNALASELLGGVGEEGVDSIGGVELAGAVEELRGEDFGIRWSGLGKAEVERAKRIAVRSAEHTAALAAGVVIVALARIGKFEGHRKFPFRNEVVA